MTTWNHRVVRREYPNAVEWERVSYEIHEAHYDNETGSGSPSAVTIDGIVPYGATTAELRETLERMLRSLDKPVLDYETREEIPDTPTPPTE